MTSIVISSILLIGVVSALMSYIPKIWIEKNIVKEIDPDETNF